MDKLTFTTKLVEFTAWPIAAVLLCLILKRPIEKLLSRLNKAKHKDTVLDFNPDIQRVSGTLEGHSSIIDAIPQYSLGLIGEAEKKINKAFEQLKVKTDSEKLKVLVKHHANLQIRSAFIEINFSIFGSQLRLLQELNVQPGPVESEFLISFYDRAKQQYPDYYKSSTFERYLKFLKSVALINTENGKYSITGVGRGFLLFLTESGISTNRLY